MGLLEQLMAKLDIVIANQNAMMKGQPVSVTVENNTDATLVTEQTETSVTVTTVELDKNGIQWDERIHAGTKRKNADGTWSLKKGVDKELAAQIIAEYQSAAPAAETETTTAPSKPSAPAAPSAPTPPAPPAKPGVPAAPSKPGVPSAPKAEDAGPTVKAARLSNVLINDMGVDYDLVIAGVLTPLGYDQFGSVPAEQAADVLKDLEKWEENLKNLVKEFADLRSMAEGTEHAQAVEEGLAYYVSNNDGEGDDPATIPFAKLYDAYVEVAKWSNEWEPVLAALKG
ncbi:hypothetical protein KLEA5_gp34 [Aeromonas phage vB_AveS_KLEA5]|nr:hypothetical protein KLEA5_gp34 [Aeromonas phage vB_AveS_KLEA5]